MHIGTPRNGVPANEFTMNLSELTGAGRSTTDYWVRYSLGSMVFAASSTSSPASGSARSSTRRRGSRIG